MSLVILKAVINVQISSPILVFTQCKPQFRAFSETWTTSLLVGSAMITLQRFLLMQPLKTLAELQRQGLKPYILCISLKRFFVILHKRPISWKIYRSFMSERFLIFSVWNKNFQLSYSSLLIVDCFSSLKHSVFLKITYPWELNQDYQMVLSFHRRWRLFSEVSNSCSLFFIDSSRRHQTVFK